MTSKEALKYLIEKGDMDYYLNFEERDKAISVIENDLKLLEFLNAMIDSGEFKISQDAFIEYQEIKRGLK